MMVVPILSATLSGHARGLVITGVSGCHGHGGNGKGDISLKAWIQHRSLSISCLNDLPHCVVAVSLIWRSFLRTSQHADKLDTDTRKILGYPGCNVDPARPHYRSPVFQWQIPERSTHQNFEVKPAPDGTRRPLAAAAAAADAVKKYARCYQSYSPDVSTYLDTRPIRDRLLQQKINIRYHSN